MEKVDKLRRQIDELEASPSIDAERHSELEAALMEAMREAGRLTSEWGDASDLERIHTVEEAVASGRGISPEKLNDFKEAAEHAVGMLEGSAENGGNVSAWHKETAALRIAEYRAGAEASHDETHQKIADELFARYQAAVGPRSAN
jgi:hypothetical protein